MDNTNTLVKDIFTAKIILMLWSELLSLHTTRLIIHNTIPGDLLAEEILDDICIINIFFNHTPIQTFYHKYALILDDFKELLHWTIFLFQFKNGTFNRILVHYFENISNWYFIICFRRKAAETASSSI